jgi:hypothetical protein
MPADDDDHLGLQFGHDMPDLGKAKPTHRVTAFVETEGIRRTMGTMLWNSRGILNIGVDPEHVRRGVATAMWHEGHRLAEQHGRIPKPKHSPDRTAMGDAWARSVGGRLPRRSR